MTYASSSKFRLDDEALVQLNQTTNVIKENYIRAKAIISVGVVSTERHLGASTLAINLTKFLSELSNTTACYIEYNNHKLIESLEGAKGTVVYKDIGKLNYNGIDMYYYPDSTANIQKYGYEFYIYDFGSFEELTADQKDNFLNKDLKILISGSKAWEEIKLLNTLYEIADADNICCYLNFVPEETQNDVRKYWGALNNNVNLYFMNLTYNPFEVKNQATFNVLMKEYLHESIIVEEKSKGIKGLFRKDKKNKGG